MLDMTSIQTIKFYCVDTTDMNNDMAAATETFQKYVTLSVCSRGYHATIFVEVSH